MNLFWIGAGFLLGIINHSTRWWVIQTLDPHYNLFPPVRLALCSSAMRIMFTGVIFYFAIQQEVHYGFLLVTSLFVTRWLGLIFINRKCIYH